VLQLANIHSAVLAKPAYELPPLILHPISRCGEALPDPSSSGTQNLRAEARRVEMRMLCYLGKDLARWVEQCREFTSTHPDLHIVTEGELLDVLVENPPENVVSKMKGWGVSDFRAIFARALGLRAVFQHPPAREQISEIFLLDLSHFAEALYRARRQAFPKSPDVKYNFQFEVYASGEYAQMLERSWGL
jgi:hypothetical protein